MSTVIQQKLLHHEVTPPDGVWENIASDLDDAALEYRFPALLNNLSVSPPNVIWDKISSTLDNAYTTEDISAKLYAAEVTPPAVAWLNITAELDAVDEDPVPKYRRISPIIKFAAAAVITGFLAFGAIRLFNGNDKAGATAALDPKNTVAEAVTHDATDTNPLAKVNNSLTANDPDEARNDAALEESKHSYAKLDINHSKISTIAAGFSFTDYADEDNITESGISSVNMAKADNSDRYVVLMTPDGHLIRMSKKLSNLVCCVSGEEADQQCKNQVEKWRKQLACSEASHPGNFMDILSLVGSLQENQ